MYLINGLGDQIWFLVWGGISNLPFTISNAAVGGFEPYTVIFAPFIRPLANIQPIFTLFISLFLTAFGAESYNLFLLLTILTTFTASYFLFRRFHFWYVYATIFTFSSYMWSHLGIHPILSQLWVFPLFFHFFLKKKRPVFLGVLLAISILVSNYNGYILLVFLGSYTIAKNILRLWRFKRIDIAQVRHFIGTVGIAFVLSIVFLSPYIKANYLEEVTQNTYESKQAIRSFEDFFTFSSRPWYFVLPPVGNPIFGEFSKSALSRIAGSGYFLADDYFKGEHAGNYFGLTFLGAVAFISGKVLLLGTKGLENSSRLSQLKEVKHFVILFGLTAFIIFLFMMPPFFTVSGIKFWTPGALLYKFFPMFRVTARLGAVLLLLLLVVLAKCVNFLVVSVWATTASSKKNVVLILLVVVTIITLVEVYVPPKIYSPVDPGEGFTYIAELPDPETHFVVYPYDKTDDAMFWLAFHEKLLINPAWYNTATFQVEEFTEKLITKEGLQEASSASLHAEYLLVFKPVSQEQLDFFLTTPQLSLVEQLADSYIFLFN